MTNKKVLGFVLGIYLLTGLAVGLNFNSQALAAAGGGFTITKDFRIGSAVVNGTTKSVLYINPTGIIAQDNTNFQYDATARTLSIDATGTGTSLHTGPTAGTTNAVVGGAGVEFIGTNNTTGGMNLILGNKSAGTSAFVDLFLQNDLADATGTHFGVLNLNSSTYSDTTFGTAVAVPNQLNMYGTDGPTMLGTTKSGSFMNVIIGGSASANETARFNTTDLTVGLTGTLTGKIKFAGSTSTSITLQGQAVGSSGVLTLPAATDTLVGKATTDTFTNKRRTYRQVTVTQSATPAINSDNTDIASITGLAQAITSMTTSLTGTPVAGDLMEVQITDNATARAITWGASFASTTVTCPTTTVISTMLRILVQWNAATSKWDCIASA